MPEDTDRDAGMWAAACHLAAFAAFLGIPFGHIAGPLLVWLLKRRDSAFVDDQGREAVNFQISLSIYLVVLGVLAIPGIVLAALTSPVLVLIPIGFALVAGVLLLAGLVLVVVGAVRANDGIRFRYPLTVRFLR